MQRTQKRAGTDFWRGWSMQAQTLFSYEKLNNCNCFKLTVEEKLFVNMISVWLRNEKKGVPVIMTHMSQSGHCHQICYYFTRAFSVPVTYQAAAVAHQPMCSMSAIDGWKIEWNSRYKNGRWAFLLERNRDGDVTDHVCRAVPCPLLGRSAGFTHWLIIVRLVKSINRYINQVSHQTWIDLPKKSSNLVQKGK